MKAHGSNFNELESEDNTCVVLVGPDGECTGQFFLAQITRYHASYITFLSGQIFMSVAYLGDALACVWRAIDFKICIVCDLYLLGDGTFMHSQAHGSCLEGLVYCIVSLCPRKKMC